MDIEQIWENRRHNQFVTRRGFRNIISKLESGEYLFDVIKEELFMEFDMTESIVLLILQELYRIELITKESLLSHSNSLIYLCFNRKEEEQFAGVAKFFLEMGLSLDINAIIDDNNNTFLIKACLDKNNNMVEFLLTNSANITENNSGIKTARDIAKISLKEAKDVFEIAKDSYYKVKIDFNKQKNTYYKAKETFFNELNVINRLKIDAYYNGNNFFYNKEKLYNDYGKEEHIYSELELSYDKVENVFSEAKKSLLKAKELVKLLEF